MRRIFIFGATSAIAEATARLFARDGDCLFLVARDSFKLMALADDLRVRGAARVLTDVADATDYSRHQGLIQSAIQGLGGLDTALISHGILGDQGLCEQSFEATRRVLEINALGTVSVLTHIANQFEAQGFGTIAAISSVAGDRGRRSNYVYGASKAALSAYMQGLRNRLHRSGVHVLTIKPGFVDSPMTSAFRKGPLWARPEQIASGIFRAVKNQKEVVYLPWFWSPVSAALRLIPESVFKRMSL